MHFIIVVNQLKDWPFQIEDIEVITAKTYLTDPAYSEIKQARIFNFCNSYRYQTIGYYVTLIAEARGHKTLPSMIAMQDIKSQSLIRSVSDDLSELIQKTLKPLKSKEFTLSVYFGKNLSPHYDKLCQQLAKRFEIPMFQASFTYNKQWIINNINAIALKDIPEHHEEYAKDFAEQFFARKRFHPSKISNYAYQIAILIDEEEKTPPSDAKALKKFMQAAESLNLGTELITKDDYGRLAEFDGLFIRVTTNVNHYTYRFSRKAEAEGLIVIDDPASILRCSNKVYLMELLQKARIPTPIGMIVHKGNTGEVLEKIGLPCVLKIPDGAFSKGVVKVERQQDLMPKLEEFLTHSELVIAQKFSPTDYDWRIGILNRNPVFACRYYMAKGHWQIYNWGANKRDQEGDDDFVPLKDVPHAVLAAATKAANLIGNGLYGVDLKVYQGQPMVIEINDNPNIDVGIEDRELKDELYKKVMQTFLQRIVADKNKTIAGANT